MADGNGQTSPSGKLLHLHLPEPVASPIGPAPISNDKELFTAGIELFSDLWLAILARCS
jgi:hypothetical protein